MLAETRPWLAGQGVLFPETGFASLPRGKSPDSIRGHALLGDGIREAPSEWGGLMIAALGAEIAASGADRVLIGSETFLAPGTGLDPAAAEAVLGRFGTVRPLVWLRRPDAYAELLYREILSWAGRRITAGLPSFVRGRTGADWLDLEARLAPWIGRFGPAMVVRSYDDAVAGPGIAADLAAVLGLPGPPPLPEALDRTVNASLNPALVNLLRALNARDDLTPERKRAIVHELHTGPDWAPTRREAESTLVTPPLWAVLAERYGPACDRLAEGVMQGPTEAFRFPAERPERRVTRQRQTEDEARALVLRLWPAQVPRPAVPARRRIGIFSLLRQSPEQTRAFVAYHLRLGIDHIRLYFDDPDDPALPGLAAHPQISAVACDAGFWQRLGAPADQQFDRQRAVRRDAQATLAGMGIDWNLYLDADELVWGDAHLALAEAPAGCRLVRLEPAEAVTDEGMDEGVFAPRWFKRWPRTPGEIAAARAEYAGLQRLSRVGFFGHCEGKSLVRSDADLTWLSPHTPRGTRSDLADITAEAALVLHFDCMGFAAWQAKIERRVYGPVRYAGRKGRRAEQAMIVARLMRHGQQDELRALFEDWYLFDAARLARLQAAGLMMRADIPAGMFSLPGLGG